MICRASPTRRISTASGITPQRPNRAFMKRSDASWSIEAWSAAAQLGISEGLQPAEPLEGYGYDPAKADRLPADLATALDALEADDALAGALGKPFVTMFLTYKRHELERFSQWVTDWEFREYAYHL